MYKAKPEDDGRLKGSKSVTNSKLTDINCASVHQIKGVPGVDDTLAEKIVKYRKLYGRFHSLEELWRVSGMTRGRYQLLTRHCRIEYPKPVIRGGTIPKKKIQFSLTDSMLDLMCKGKSVQGPETNSGATQQQTTPGSKDLELMPGGFTRSGRKFRDRRTHQKSAPKERTIYRAAESSARPNSSCLPRSSVTYNRREQTHKEPEECVTSANKASPTESPAVTGKDKDTGLTQYNSTAYGNNISFQCMIDRRFLKKPSSMALHFGDDGKLRAVGNKAKQLTGGQGPTVAVGNKRPVRPRDTPIGSVSCGGGNKSLWQIPAPEDGEARSQTTSTTSSPLSQENLSVFERMTEETASERTAIIEAWIVRVNEAKDLEAVSKRKRSSSSASGNRVSWPLAGGKKTVSPPPKKLLRRPMLEHSVSSPNSKCLTGGQAVSGADPSSLKPKMSPLVTFEDTSRPAPHPPPPAAPHPSPRGGPQAGGTPSGRWVGGVGAGIGRGVRRGMGQVANDCAEEVCAIM